jgi:hypothetical protein
VLVCKKCDDSKCLVKFLNNKTDVRVIPVGCQKICHGAVVGLDVGGRMEWFERVNKAKAMVSLALVSAAEGSVKVPKPLAKRRVTKRSGRPPR